MNYIRIEEIKKELKKNLPEKTYLHTLRTVNMAMELCVDTAADRNVVFLAALLHDCAKKTKPNSEQLLELDDFAGYEKVIHAPLGAVIARQKYGIQEERVLNAIRYHTTGRPQMNLEEQIVFLADAIEDERDYPGVEQIREKTKLSIADGVLESLRGTVQFETGNGSRLHPLTLQAIAYFEQRKGI
jgi:hydrolase, HD family